MLGGSSFKRMPGVFLNEATTGVAVLYPCTIVHHAPPGSPPRTAQESTSHLPRQFTMLCLYELQILLI
jgi:hypothetical protein